MLRNKGESRMVRTSQEHLIGKQLDRSRTGNPRWLSLNKGMVGATFLEHCKGDVIANMLKGEIVITQENWQQVLHDISIDKLQTVVWEMIEIAKNNSADYINTIAERIVSSGMTDRFLDKLVIKNTDDYIRLTSNLVRHASAGGVLGNIDKFDTKMVSEDIDVSALIDDVLQGDDGDDLTDYMEGLLASGVSAQMITDKINDTEYFTVLIGYFEELSIAGAEIDIADLVRRAIDEGDLNTVFFYAESLSRNDAGINFDELIRSTLQGDKSAGLLNSVPRLLSASKYIDCTSLFNQLVKLHKYGVISRNLAGFASVGVEINVDDLVDDINDAGEGYLITNNIEAFVNLGADIDAVSMIHDLVKKDIASCVFFLKGLINLNRDVSEVVSVLGKSKFSHALIQYLEKIPNVQELIDVQNVVHKALDRDVGIVTGNLAQLINVGVESGYLLEELLARDQYRCLVGNLELFRDEDITPEVIEKLFPYIDIGSAVAQHRFKLVSMWMREALQRGDVDSLYGFLDSERAVGVYESMLADGRVINAGYFRDCMDLCGIDYSNVISEVSDYVDYDRTKDNLNHDIVEESITFYVDSYIDVIVQRVAQIPDWRYKMSGDDLTYINLLVGVSAQSVENVSTWLGQYLIRAINSEFFSADDMELPLINISEESFSTEASREEVLNYLDSASSLFLDDGWHGKFGGASWARIAQVTYALFAGIGDRRIVIDMIFDLEHNYGTVFANVSGIDNHKNIHRILDIKRSSEFPVNMSDIPDSLHVDSDFLSEQMEKVRRVKKLATKVGLQI